MTDARPIRVLVVDDHAVVRSGLAAVLLSSDDLELAGEAGSGEEAVRQAERLMPDVVLMDLKMPGMDGVAATRAIHGRWPEIRIIVLTSFKDKEFVDGALKAGAMSYLLKNVSAEELTRAIRGAAAGEPRFSPEAAQVLIQGIRQPEGPGYGLTEREREILGLMVEGLPNGDIAKRL